MTRIYIVKWFDDTAGGDTASYHTSARKARAEHTELAERGGDHGIAILYPIAVGTLRKQPRLAQLMDALNGLGSYIVENQRPLD